MVRLNSWGNYPEHPGVSIPFDSGRPAANFSKNCIPYGNGRSYGDSCIADRMIEFKRFNHFLNFDRQTGVVVLQSGVLLSEIIEVSVPYGWFLQVNPGTKLITVGGAIASDVHGKNHHLAGCFSECVNWFNLLLPDGAVVKCSREQNVELFRATCGGMGLTGIILEAELQLKKIASANIIQTTIKTKNLRETFEVFETIREEPYSVAWVDCLRSGPTLGRSIIMYGDFEKKGNLAYKPNKSINIPFYFPSFTLNIYTVNIFNWFYYHKVRKRISVSKVSLDSFFFPLDAINHWNRIYGSGGFTQYQFILPKGRSFEGLQVILKEVARSGKGSFLSVLKLYGKENANYLSFPMEGYSLTLDFKIEKGVFDLLDRLDEIVIDHGGRIYLAKDVRVSRATFEKGYPLIEKFRAVRSRYGLSKTLNSLQSLRVGI